MSWEIAASLGSSQAEVKRRSAFRVTPTASMHLPRFGLFFVVVRLIVELIVEVEIRHGRYHAGHETGSVAGLTLSRLGGG